MSKSHNSLFSCLHHFLMPRQQPRTADIMSFWPNNHDYRFPPSPSFILSYISFECVLLLPLPPASPSPLLIPLVHAPVCSSASSLLPSIPLSLASSSHLLISPPSSSAFSLLPSYLPLCLSLLTVPLSHLPLHHASFFLHPLFFLATPSHLLIPTP